MRLVTFLRDGLATVGVRRAADVLPLDLDAMPSVRAIVSAGAEGLETVRRRVAGAHPSEWLPLDGLPLLPPLPDPGKIACIGLNYAAHRAEGGLSVDKPAFPDMFHKMPSTMVGHGAEIHLPLTSVQLDFECELAVVIGRACANVTADEAPDYIFGYTILNDGSVRDWQIGKALAAGKNADRSGGCGPEIVTADELPRAARGIRLCTRLNGQVMQDANTDQMIFDVAEAVSLLSGIHQLNPGDLVSTGTPSGVGAVRKPPVWLQAGDLLEMEISGIGLLRNRIAAPTAG